MPWRTNLHFVLVARMKKRLTVGRLAPTAEKMAVGYLMMRSCDGERGRGFGKINRVGGLF